MDSFDCRHLFVCQFRTLCRTSCLSLVRVAMKAEQIGTSENGSFVLLLSARKIYGRSMKTFHEAISCVCTETVSPYASRSAGAGSKSTVEIKEKLRPSVDGDLSPFSHFLQHAATTKSASCFIFETYVCDRLLGNEGGAYVAVQSHY